MTIAKQLSEGRSMPTKIGACLRCGKSFNEAGILELPYPSDTPDGADSHS